MDDFEAFKKHVLSACRTNSGNNIEQIHALLEMINTLNSSINVYKQKVVKCKQEMRNMNKCLNDANNNIKTTTASMIKNIDGSRDENISRLNSLLVSITDEKNRQDIVINDLTSRVETLNNMIETSIDAHTMEIKRYMADNRRLNDTVNRCEAILSELRNEINRKESVIRDLLDNSGQAQQNRDTMIESAMRRIQAGNASYDDYTLLDNLEEQRKEREHKQPRVLCLMTGICENDDNCSICLDDIKKNSYAVLCESGKCFHHAECIANWLKYKNNTCPKCKLELKYMKFDE
jgi:uncharacterized protein YukE